MFLIAELHVTPQDGDTTYGPPMIYDLLGQRMLERSELQATMPAPTPSVSAPAPPVASKGEASPAPSTEKNEASE